MPTEPPGKSPFASANSSGAGTPFAERPEPPRLGILHLMVLTACVAAAMGVTLWLRQAAGRDDLRPGREVSSVTVGTLYGIAKGAALAGLILFFARRLRRFPFPTHPGEYLLVMLGISVVLGLARTGVRTGVMKLGVPIGRSLMWGTWAMELGFFSVNAVVFIWALVRVKTRRWRIFLLAIPVSYVVTFILMFLCVRIWPGLSTVNLTGIFLTLPGAVLAVVVLRDHLDGQRYPWSHWLGVVLRLWFDACGIVIVGWRTILSWDRFF